MRREKRCLRSRFIKGFDERVFEMLSDTYHEGDVFVLDMDSVVVIDWTAPVEWFGWIASADGGDDGDRDPRWHSSPPPPGTPIVHDTYGAIWTLVRQPAKLWVQVLEPKSILLPLELFADDALP